ncbi:MAG: PhoH family protein [Candidatus Scalindua sp.]|jgi:phosphate starvation-inducible PhoH-like protein|nr:PhoH family protein [Candidatus Scalindua sp.]MBT5305988.1 PhoH family protein [Candidatus Scalindua sp.]MBT6052722.1 PhoH family protein [Candidatus Scalindua sp.]MBT6564263.1 PhoH family protein [Candidatus Scalindua sp.]MBT7209939.1 PhoH family protein [Candidatus Scalindua sp.]
MGEVSTNSTIIEKKIHLENNCEASLLFGYHDKNLKTMRDVFGVKIVARDGVLTYEGERGRVKRVTDVVKSLLKIIRTSGRLEEDDVDIVMADIDRGIDTSQSDQSIEVFTKGQTIRPKTDGQASYIKAIRNNDLVFCIGPAGTGKTYLAVSLALSTMKSGYLKKIVLARPAVEAGERLGFLPGDIQAKVNPYLRPLYDALADMLEVGQVKKYIENNLIEILPLAFMRGRTLNDSFIILDEAQNCTVKQMKTFLTRFGIRTKVVVTGDITQIDLPSGEKSGLIDVQERLKGVAGVDFVYLTRNDIVRHRLVRDIVEAYDNQS